MKVGIVLLNLGGPDSLEAVEPFLYNLFVDPDIINFPGSFLVRKPLARLISSKRHPRIQEQYKQIGGKSPLKDFTLGQARLLEEKLNEKFPARVFAAMRHWHPFIAEAWADRPADSIAGCLWRLYLLRSWVYADPVGVAREFETGRERAAVSGVVAGVADPPGPDELRDMVDEVLRGIAGSDFADVLLRAAAFARVVAAGRAELPDTDTVAAARIQKVADQLDRAARLELAGELA